MNIEEERPEEETRIEEPRKKIIVPTLKEKIELGLSDEEWLMICYEANKDGKCAREIGGHKLCDLCPKSKPKQKKPKNEELAKDIETLLSTTINKLVSPRR